MRRLLACAALAGVLGGCGERAVAPPNLLMVVWDTTRADHLSPYGADIELPHLEALAARGLVFDEVRSVSSLTPVSAASFLSGELPAKTGVKGLLVNAGDPMTPGLTTLPQWLQAAGWNTAGFVSAPPMGHRYGFERGFDVFDDEVNANAEWLRRQKVGNAYQRRADATTDAALAWFEGARDGAAPFAMLVHYFDAHDPSLVPPRAFLEPRVGFALPAELDQRRHLGELFDGAEPGRGGPRAADLIELYDAEIEFMDLQLGRVLDALEAAGELDNTLVVLLADHGESLGDHDFWTHGLMWDEQLRVPLVLAGPGVERVGREPRALSLVALAPTLAELLDVGTPAGLFGRSFAPLARRAAEQGPAAVPATPIFAEAHNAPGDRTGRPTANWALVAPPHKLIMSTVNAGGDQTAAQLFDLERDPGELQDLAAERPELAGALDTLLRSYSSGSDGSALDPAALDPEARRMLEELGYL